MTSQLVVSELFFSSPDPKSENNSHESTNKNILALGSPLFSKVKQSSGI